MDEIKQLVDMIAHMPSMALWVLGGYLFYKLAILGSMYGTLRYVAGLLFGWLTTRKVQTVEMRPMLDGLVITGEKDAFMAQLQRLRVTEPAKPVTPAGLCVVAEQSHRFGGWGA